MMPATSIFAGMILAGNLAIIVASFADCSVETDGFPPWNGTDHHGPFAVRLSNETWLGRPLVVLLPEMWAGGEVVPKFPLLVFMHGSTAASFFAP